MNNILLELVPVLIAMTTYLILTAFFMKVSR